MNHFRIPNQVGAQHQITQPGVNPAPLATVLEMGEVAVNGTNTQTVSFQQGGLICDIKATATDNTGAVAISRALFDLQLVRSNGTILTDGLVPADTVTTLDGSSTVIWNKVPIVVQRSDSLQVRARNRGPTSAIIRVTFHQITEMTLREFMDRGMYA